MKMLDEARTFAPGDIVYVFYRNPHTQDVANIQEAAVVNNPERPGEFRRFFVRNLLPVDQ